MRQYLDAVKQILDTGTRKPNRTGVDTLSTFGVHYNIDLQQGFPLLTTKSISWKNIVVELLWFLSGHTDIGILKKHGCKFWDAWADENGKVPSAYGSFWTNFPPSQEPEAIVPREPTENNYEKPHFDEVSVEDNHEYCGRIFESQKCGAFKIIRHAGSDAEGRSLFDIQFTATGYIKRAVRSDVIQQGTVRDRYALTVHGTGYYGERTTRTEIDKDLLKVWLHMLDRCYNPECKEYPYYGLKGITVCARWHNFANFHADCRTLPNWVNKRDNPKKYALDKDFYSARCYSPTTCVWLSHVDNRLYAHARAVRIEYPDGDAVVVERGESFRGYKFAWAEGVYRKPLPNNQIRWLIDTLKRDPMSRRMVVSAWAPGNAQTSKLPPCHCMFVVNVQNERCRLCGGSGEVGFDEGIACTRCSGARTEKVLCLQLLQRSCDAALGAPYNIASYALLMHLLSRFSGIPVGTFGHTLVDAHIYTAKADGSKAEFDHVPGLREQLTREPRPLPRLHISDKIQSLEDVEALMGDDVTTEQVMSNFVLEGYSPHPAINFKVAV